MTSQIALSASRRLLAVFAALLMVAATLAVTAAPAAAETNPTQAEHDFHTKLNQSRAQHGKPALTMDGKAGEVARAWSSEMARTNTLAHNPNLRADVERVVTRDWQRIGENVGYGWDVQSLHDAFYSSTGHRANMLGDFNRVGVGVVVTDRIWVTFVFLKAPGYVYPAQSECGAKGYVLDGFGGVHATGGAPHVGSSGYWLGWHIARDLSMLPTGKGHKLDGFGGIWPVGGAQRIHPGGYWRGWDVARAVAVTSDGTGAYVLDAFGGIHAAGTAPHRKGTGYWLGWDIARDIVLDPTNTSRGYVLDGHGGLWPFGGMPAPRLSHYLGSVGAASVSMNADGKGGYIVGRNGGVHAFAVGGNAMPGGIGHASVPAPAVGLVTGSQPAVVTTHGHEVGTLAACGRSARWPFPVAVTAVSAG